MSPPDVSSEIPLNDVLAGAPTLIDATPSQPWVVDDHIREHAKAVLLMGACENDESWADQVPSTLEPLIPLATKQKKDEPVLSCVLSNWVHAKPEPPKEKPKEEAEPIVVFEEPLVPDDFVEEELPPDEVLVARALGAGNLVLSVAVLSIFGAIIGVSAALLGS